MNPENVPPGIRAESDRESAGSPGYRGPAGVPSTETETETDVTPLGPLLRPEPDTRTRAPRITRHDLDRIERRIAHLEAMLGQVLELLGRSASPAQAHTDDTGAPTWLPGTGRLGGNRRPSELSEEARAALAALDDQVDP